MFLKTSYEKYLRKEYSIPKNKNIVIKRGFVISKNVELLNSADFESDPFKIRNLVYKDIKNEINRIYSLIEKASGEIDDLLGLKENTGNENEQIYNLQIELAMDGLFSELSNSMRDLTNKAYKSFIVRLNENSKDPLENFEYLCNYALRDKEIYVKINLWVENLKKWFLENMESNLYGETNPVLGDDPVNSTKFLSAIESKGFFSDVLDSAEEFFSSLKDKIDRLIFNIVSFVQAETKKLYYYYMKGVDCYKVVLSDNGNPCEKCREMDGKAFYLSELKAGKNAPPFHPNCGCTIIGKRTLSDINEPLELVYPMLGYDRRTAVWYAIQWYNDKNPKYPQFSDQTGDCANFVSQCLVAGGFKMNEYWHYYDRNDMNPMILFKPELRWSYTEAWSVAREQYEYLKNSNLVKEEIILTGPDQIAAAANDPKNPVKAGDVMYLKFDEDYPHHATIISKVENGMIYYAAHTDPHDYKPLEDFFNEHPNGQAHILRIK